MNTIHWSGKARRRRAPRCAASAAAIAIGPRKKPSVAISPTASTPAAIIHQTQSSTEAILSLLTTARSPETSSARSTSASRSAVSSQPADRRTKPSGTESPPQRARRSARCGRCRSWSRRSRARPRRGSARRAPRCRGRTTRPCRSRPSGAGRPRGRGRSAGPGSARRSRRRERRGAGRSRARCRSARSSRMASVGSERCASHTSNGPGIDPAWRRHTRSASIRSGSRVVTYPSIRSAWPDICFVALVSA